MDIDLMLRIGSERLSVAAAISGSAEVRQREPIPEAHRWNWWGRQRYFTARTRHTDTSQTA
jgi:hypothetical protein